MDGCILYWVVNIGIWTRRRVDTKWWYDVIVPSLRRLNGRSYKQLAKEEKKDQERNKLYCSCQVKSPLLLFHVAMSHIDTTEAKKKMARWTNKTRRTKKLRRDRNMYIYLLWSPMNSTLCGFTHNSAPNLFSGTTPASLIWRSLVEIKRFHDSCTLLSTKTPT